MEYVYAVLMLHETGAEINEQNLTATIEAAGGDVPSSRVKAVVAALEDVDIAATEAASIDTGGEPALEDDGSEDDSDAERESSGIQSLFDDEHDADDEGIERDDDAVEDAARPSDLDGEAVDASDESEA
ncbi:50S ribosomal protein P1 [Halomicroarcula sp. GCM10025324]|uniref:50S ribosomal protein P1 n=1 Tax=Haloarcula TaxID=2237 RepID=UPI0023E8C8EC|nr:50S ribosomal protein P1 [Halomicroarcula sp. ZS-22-S1]